MIFKKAMRCFVGMLWYGFAGVIVLAAVLLTTARLLLPLVEDYRAEAENALSGYAGQPVRVKALKAKWNGFEPQLHFTDVRLFDKQNQAVLFQFSDARMGIDVYSSIKSQDFVPSNFTISGIELSVSRQADKSISIDGLVTSSDNSESNYTDLILKWLLQQPDIGIESSTITWTDIPLGEEKIVFSDVDLRLKNDTETHQLTGHVSLPKHLGKEIDIALDMTGNIEDIPSWHGDIYVKASSLLVSSWWRKSLAEDVSLAGGITDLELWGRWQQQQVASLEGKVNLSGLEFAGKRAPKTQLKSLTTGVLWKQNDKEWSLHLSKLLPVTEQGAWQESELSLRYNRAMQKFAAVSGYAQLSDVLPVMNAMQLLDDATAKKIASMQPHVILDNTSLLVSLAENTWHVNGRFTDLSLQSSGTIPGVTGLSGSFIANEQQGSLQIDSNKAVVDTAGLFRKPVDLLKLTGSMQWQKQGADWSIAAADFDLINDDLSLRANMNLLIPNTGSPKVDLLVNFKNADASKTSKYLPVKFLATKTVEWLDKSIIKGMSPKGQFVLRGPVDKFPFDHGEGKFEVRFDVVDGELDYEPGWPLISDMQGEVIFSGRSMDIIGRSGRILDANVHDVTAHIQDIDLDDPLLELKGHVDASTPDLIKYVTAANLAEGYSKQLKELSTQGSASLKLDIKIPTSSGNGTVSGVATLKNASLGLKDKKIQLNSINGDVQVSNKGLQGKGIKGRLFKKPVTIKLSHGDDFGTALSLSVTGLFDLNKLLAEKFRKDFPIISNGEGEWVASLAFREPKGEENFLVLALQSDLNHVAVNLPAPFLKASNAIVPLKISAAIRSSDKLQLEIDYGDDIDAIIALKNNAGDFEYAGSSIAFGDTLPLSPSAPRISIVGQIGSLSLDDWMTYLSTSTVNNTKSANNNAMEWLEEVNLAVSSLRASGTNFSVKKLRMTREGEAWRSTIDADRAKGEILIPFDTSTGLVKANFEFLKIIRVEGSNSDVSINPRELPGLTLSVDQLAFDGAELGALNMAISKTANGLVLDRLAIVGPDLEFTSNGSWQVENDQQVTKLTSKLKAEKFSKLLKRLGYSVGFEGGKSRNTTQLEWQGGPLQFDLKRLRGVIQIRIDKGQLLDVSPGAGRVFGLLSLQALPRRLTLDFSDLFKKGFSFDRIKGNFQLDRGDAYTTDLYLNGPAARLDVSGRTGLVSQDYDQLVTVTPNLTGSLPIASALVGGPIAGGIVFALDKLFRPAIDDITRYQYTVTGSWDDPQVVKLEDKKELKAVAEEP